MNLKTIREAAAMLDVKESIVRRAVRCGGLSVMTLGNRMLVNIDEAREVLTKPEGVKIEVVSAETGLTVSAIRRGVREGWIPYTKPGNCHLFDIDAVRAAIEQRMRKLPARVSEANRGAEVSRSEMNAEARDQAKRGARAATDKK